MSSVDNVIVNGRAYKKANNNYVPSLDLLYVFR